MHRARLALLALLFTCFLVPCAMAVSLQINASPIQAHVGDVVTLTGSIQGVKTIAVYLFMTGPELPPQGVILENLNIATGRGLFTTAPVNLDDGTWEYIWDTSIILGDLKPGTYSVYAVSTPVDRLRYSKGEYAKTEIEFLPSDTPPNEAPLSGILTIAALVITVAVGIAARQRCP